MKEWVPIKNEYQSGDLWKYAQLVGPAINGAVTHPGAEKEEFCYAVRIQRKQLLRIDI